MFGCFLQAREGAVYFTELAERVEYGNYVRGGRSAGHKFTAVYDTSRCGLRMLQIIIIIIIIIISNIASRKAEVFLASATCLSFDLQNGLGKHGLDKL